MLDAALHGHVQREPLPYFLRLHARNKQEEPLTAEHRVLQRTNIVEVAAHGFHSAH